MFCPVQNLKIKNHGQIKHIKFNIFNENLWIYGCLLPAHSGKVANADAAVAIGYVYIDYRLGELLALAGRITFRLLEEEA